MSLDGRTLLRWGETASVRARVGPHPVLRQTQQYLQAAPLALTTDLDAWRQERPAQLALDGPFPWHRR